MDLIMRKGDEVKRRKRDEKDDAVELIQCSQHNLAGNATSTPTPINPHLHPTSHPTIAATANTNRGTSSLTTHYKFKAPLIKGAILPWIQDSENLQLIHAGAGK